MLEFEDDNRELLAKTFRAELGCARDLLEVGQRIAESLECHFEKRVEESDARSAV